MKYLLRNIDVEWWHTVKTYALKHRMSVQQLIISAIKEYIKGEREK